MKKDSNKNINIAIIGTGPVGLFLACYLQMYYNDSWGLNNEPRVNIVLFDNRLEKPGLRKPYTRLRTFATASKFFSLIFPKFYCWSGQDEDSILCNPMGHMCPIKLRVLS